MNPIQGQINSGYVLDQEHLMKVQHARAFDERTQPRAKLQSTPVSISEIPQACMRMDTCLSEAENLLGILEERLLCVSSGRAVGDTFYPAEASEAAGCGFSQAPSELTSRINTFASRVDQLASRIRSTTNALQI